MEVLPAEEIERFWTVGHKAAVYEPHLQHRARDYAHLYCANYYLRRKLRIYPTPPARSRLIDAVKRPLGAALMAYTNKRYPTLRSY